MSPDLSGLFYDGISTLFRQVLNLAFILSDMRTMAMRILLLAFSFLLSFQSALGDEWVVPSDKGPFEIDIRRLDWFDDFRTRTIPVKLYVPDTDASAPIIIFSHGLGGSREVAPYLGERWSSWGFLVIMVQHPGSDQEVWRGKKGKAVREALSIAAKDPQVAVSRYEDIPFVLDELTRLADEGELAADIDQGGMSGHSFGSHTTLALLGRNYMIDEALSSFKDDRIDAGMCLSPPPISTRDEDELADMFYDIDRPILHMTGTRDQSPISKTVDPADRLVPFTEIPSGPQYLVVFKDGDHSVFSGRPPRWGRGSAKDYSRIQAAVATISTAYWQSILQDNEDAENWLQSEGLESVLAPDDTVKRK